MKFQRHILCLFLTILTLTLLPVKSEAQKQDATNQYFEISKSIDIFSHVFRELNRSYVNPIHPGKMTKTAINAMLADLDPYTNFFTEADAENFKIHVRGQYGGIGIISDKKDSAIYVQRVFENAPADKAGLKPGDILLAVNGQSLKGKSLDELSVLMQGDKGTDLSLKIKKPLSGKKEILKITRDKINISVVPYAGLLGKDKDIAYVKLTSFMGPASEGIKKALDSLEKVQPHLKGVILDLRGNPGGLLKEAVRTCNLFIPEGQTVVTTKGKDPVWSRKVFKTTGKPWNTRIPLTVLVNHHSASASEIVAGTIQDLDRGVIIGTRSFGKGLVQQVRPLGFNTSMKLTVAHYYTPSGRCIQALDYAHRNPDGSVSKIPDSLKNIFKTKNGRIVKDGGGINPDVFIPEEDLDPIVKSLTYNHYIFDYATKYYYAHSTIAPAASFHLTESDFSDFKKWLGHKHFIYKTKEGTFLKEFRKEAKKEKHFDVVKEDFSRLSMRLRDNNRAVLNDNKNIILNLLSAELAERYYYQKGATLNKLNQDDATIKKALFLLTHNKDYNKILK